MGLFFGGGFDKPGPGVDANAPKKRGFFLYTDTVVRKIGKFFAIGAVYSLLSLPLLALLYFLSVFVFATPISSLQQTAYDIMVSNEVDAELIPEQLGTITFLISSMSCVFFVTMLSSGPLSAALSFVMRGFTRGEYVWVWSDGKDKIKENAKQGFAVLLIDLAVFILVPTAIGFYSQLAAAVPSMELMSMILTYILVLASLIFTMMHPYMFQLMVTFDSTFSEIFKKALVLTLAHLPMNFILTAVSVFLIVAPGMIFNVPGAFIMIVLGLTAGISVLRYPMEFYAARIIEKTYLKTHKKAHIEYEEDN